MEWDGVWVLRVSDLAAAAVTLYSLSFKLPKELSACLHLGDDGGSTRRREWNGPPSSGSLAPGDQPRPISSHRSPRFSKQLQKLIPGNTFGAETLQMSCRNLAVNHHAACLLQLVDLTDIFSGWTENRAAWNKGYEGIRQSLQEIEDELPFLVLGFHSDNGGEFLNHHLFRYLRERDRPIAFTRGRPFHKNDIPRFRFPAASGGPLPGTTREALILTGSGFPAATDPVCGDFAGLQKVFETLVGLTVDEHFFDQFAPFSSWANPPMFALLVLGDAVTVERQGGKAAE